MFAWEPSQITAEARRDRCTLAEDGVDVALSRLGVAADEIDLVREQSRAQADRVIAAAVEGDIANGVWTAAPRPGRERAMLRRSLASGEVSLAACMSRIERGLGAHLVSADEDAAPGHARVVLGPLVVDRAGERAFLPVVIRENAARVCVDAVEFARNEDGVLAPRLIAGRAGACARA